jgi:hypothetical protein
MRRENIFIHMSFVFVIISIKIYFNKRNKNDILPLTFSSEIFSIPLDYHLIDIFDKTKNKQNSK